MYPPLTCRAICEAARLAIHQLAPEGTGELVIAGVITELVGPVGVESGFEIVGFRTGVDVVGFPVGTVVIGVVISFWLLEIVLDFSNFSSTWYNIFFCSMNSFGGAFEPVRSKGTFIVKTKY